MADNEEDARSIEKAERTAEQLVSRKRRKAAASSVAQRAKRPPPPPEQQPQVPFGMLPAGTTGRPQDHVLSVIN